MFFQNSIPFICLTILALNSGYCSGIQFLNWGDDCEIPGIGGGEIQHALVGECDAGKGLICSGKACECTYKQRYSYDPVSQECRRRVGKPCQVVDATPGGDKGKFEAALASLPFNLKCHANADCVQFQIPVHSKIPPKKNKYTIGKYGSSRSTTEPPMEFETISMCVCKPPLVASSDLNTCIPAPSLNPIAEMFAEPKKKLTFRPPYYTS